jgi:hypothetical protein
LVLEAASVEAVHSFLRTSSREARI